MKESSGMHRAWSILLVSQQDIDHLYSAIVPIMQSLPKASNIGKNQSSNSGRTQAAKTNISNDLEASERQKPIAIAFVSEFKTNRDRNSSNSKTNRDARRENTKNQ